MDSPLAPCACTCQCLFLTDSVDLALGPAGDAVTDYDKDSEELCAQEKMPGWVMKAELPMFQVINIY